VAAFRSGQTSDVVLLDWNMEMAASELLRELNRFDPRVPIAMLIDGNGSDEASKGDDEADARRRVLDRVRLVADMLRTRNPEDAPHQAPALPHALRLDTKTCQAFWKGSPVNLTITEFNIVSLFAKRVGENLSYREIYDVVHGPGFCAGDGLNGYQTNVRSLIKRIRQKFHEADESFGEIENHRGYGYRWRASEAASGAEVSSDETWAGQPSTSTTPRELPARHPAVPAGAALVMVVYLASSAAG